VPIASSHIEGSSGIEKEYSKYGRSEKFRLPVGEVYYAVDILDVPSRYEILQIHDYERYVALQRCYAGHHPNF
jgi:hypothetical protein